MCTIIAIMFMMVFVVIYISFMGYAGDRISAWLHPEQDPADTGYQILQSLYAIGSGGLFGLGYMNSIQKYSYVSEPQNDFIFTLNVLCIISSFLYNIFYQL